MKFHWKPVFGLPSTVWDEAVKLAGADSEFRRRGFYESIDSGRYPEWERRVQVFDEEWAARQP